ncbi:Flp family type IVb pilin [Acinetobacter sp. 161(2023)]|uniref:Flp family type IVb pilin n=1 Tax=Acinetobacter sp. 161(2023) TaxID=3098768 RepID=UPI00300883C0
MKKTDLTLNVKMNKVRGQGMTEYIIIVALIAVAAIGVFRFYGNTARSQVSVAAAALGGQNTDAARQSATDNANAATAEGTVDKRLDTFQQGSR